MRLRCVNASPPPKRASPSTKAFGAWWDAQGFEVDYQTRAALVAMGQEIDRAREVLAATERRSIRYVYQNEFRLDHVVNSPPTKQPAPKRPEGAGAMWRP